MKKEKNPTAFEQSVMEIFHESVQRSYESRVNKAVETAVAAERLRCADICRKVSMDLYNKRSEGAAFGMAGMALSVCADKILFPNDVFPDAK